MIVDPGTLAIFALASAALIAVPGPAVLYIVTRSIHQGRRAGVASVLGIETGALVHVAAAAVGLSAVLASSAMAFSVVKYAGAAYLIGLGLWTVFSGHAEKDASVVIAVRLRRVYAQGVVVNAFNPKVALFFLAFLPQFIDPDAPSKPLAFLFLGAVFNLNGTLWNLLVAALTARLADGLERSSTIVKWFNRSVGGLFIYLGVMLVFAVKKADA